MPLNQSRHAPLTSIATSAVDSQADLSSPYIEGGPRSSTPLQNGAAGWPGTPGAGMIQSPNTPYSPGMRSTMQRQQSTDRNPFENATPGEIQMQSFQEGLPPPPPVSHSWKRIDRWAEDNYQELWDQLSEGCTQNDVNELEHELDCTLPMEVRESLQIHDGQERGGRPTGIIFGCMLLDCEEIVQEWKNWKIVNEEYLTTPAGRDSFPKAFGEAPSVSSQTSSQTATNPFWRQELLDRQDSQPPRAIQKAYAHPGWIPLARDWGGNNIAVDLAPGPVGKWGQIIIFGRDYDCKYVVARSWAAFLATVADDVSSEKVFVDDETQELKLREFRAAGVEPAYLDILRWRMDQKYGRRLPKRKQSPGLAINTQRPGSSNRGSPYGSPIEERGRSPQRLPNRAPLSSSPRGGKAKPSPLAQVSEVPAPKPIYTGGRKDTFPRKDPASDTDSQLVELATPISERFEKIPDDRPESPSKSAEATAQEGEANKENASKEPATGLGVDGIDGMKSVDI